MWSWQGLGAKIVNPLQFFLESKSFLATVGLPTVRKAIADRDPDALEILDTSIADTRLLKQSIFRKTTLEDNKDFWLLKYAAWDGHNRSWGSRSLEFGSQHSPSNWQHIIDEYLRFSHPVVAQHVINSLRYDATYADHQGMTRLLAGARTRLTPFLLRGVDNNAVNAGATITLRTNTFRIHGATDAVEAPIVFSDEEVDQSFR